MMTPRQRNKRK